MEKYINKKTFEEVQKRCYNSTVDDFPISFEQEKIAYSGLFVAKKRYATWTLMNEGEWKNNISVTGIEIVRSETPTLFRNALHDILEMILKGHSDEDIRKQVDKVKKEARNTPPEYISSNTSINNINKYITDDFKPVKGAPFHLTGTANYKKLRKLFGLENKYEDIHEGQKAHVIYTKPNPYGVNVMTFNNWPEEFTKSGITWDTNIMIEKFFLKKIRYLLEPMNRQDILERNAGIDAFFS